MSLYPKDSYTEAAILSRLGETGVEPYYHSVAWLDAAMDDWDERRRIIKEELGIDAGGLHPAEIDSLTGQALAHRRIFSNRQKETNTNTTVEEAAPGDGPGQETPSESILEERERQARDIISQAFRETPLQP